jgi:NADH:ubiquinone oxidoreductase subunit F (NADH-binding)
MSAAARVRQVTPPQGLPRLFSQELARFAPPGEPHELIASIAEAGLRGRGGGAFPTAEKLLAVAGRRRRPVVVVNAAEGEPASGKDKTLLRFAPHLVLDGAVLAARALGAKTAVVALADTARTERSAVSRAIAERSRSDRVELAIATVPDAFVSGEETALLRAIEGRAAKPTLKPPYPFERGLNGAPTLVQNAETLAHVALIARFGPAWFRSAGTADAPGSALLTLSGAFARPGVVEVELGVSLGDIVLRAGGLTEAVSAFLVGGYFGEWVPAREAGALKLTPDVLGAGAIVALPASACAAVECARVSRYLARESAGQCGPCSFGLDAIATAFEQLTRGDDRRAQILRWTAQVRGRGACRHPDGAVRFVESALATFGDELDRHVDHGRCSARARNVLPVPGDARR